MTTFVESPPNVYLRFLEDFIANILTIPLLPNRLPLHSLTELSSRLPFSSLNVLLSSLPELIYAINAESRVHLIANLVMFTPPRYSKLSSTSLDAYLQFLAALLNSLPPGALESLESVQGPGTSWTIDDSDSETELNTRVATVDSFTLWPVLPSIDPRSRKRLLILPSAAHLNSLLIATKRHPATQASLVNFFFALNTTWPGRKDKILGAVVVYAGGGLVRELFRVYVRNSPLGRDDHPGALMGILYRLLESVISTY
jgi:ubiquitin-protein ligase E3 C